MATQAKEVFLTPPLSIAGCQLWLDAADPYGTGAIPSNGSSLLTWNDKSGNGKNAEATGTPTYLTGGGVNFNASPYFLNQTFSQNLSQRSIFIVFQETITSYNAGVIIFIPTPNSGYDSSSTSGMTSEIGFPTGIWFYGNADSYRSVIGGSHPLPRGIYHDSMNGTTGSGYLNGSNVTNVTAGYTAGTCSGYALGGRWQNGSIDASYRVNGVIYEILFFNTPLITSQRQQVEGYLAWKWGLNNSLPSTHPYASVSPYQTLTLPIARSVTLKGISFLPTSVSGCSLWLDGADLTRISFSSGTNLSTWSDKSGFGNNCSNQSLGTTITYPGTQVNGLNTVNFTAGCIRGAFNGSSIINTTDVSIFIVTAETAPNDNLRMFSLTTAANYQDDTANTMLVYCAPGNYQLTFYRAGAMPSPYTVTQNVPFIYSLTQTSGTGSMWFNGGSNRTASITTSAFAVTNYNIGTQYLANQNYTGLMCEVVVYNSLLDTNKRQQMEGYLAWKWGLQGSLPGTHPYSSVSPSQTLGLPVSRATPFTSFIPTNVSGCQLWLDGNDSSSVTGTTSVTEWRDKSGNSRHLGVGSGTTSYSLKAVKLNSSYMFVTSPVDLSKLSVFLVSKTNPIWNQAVFTIRPNTSVSSGSTDGLGIMFYDNSYINIFSQNFTQYADPGTINTTLLSVQASGTLTTTLLNGTNQKNETGSTTRTSTAQGFSIGGEWNGSSYTNIIAIASIYEVIVFNVSITTNERQQMEGYLAWKWGIQTSLPSTHPYYSTPYVPYSLPRVVTKASIQVWSPLRVSGCSMWLDGNDPAGTGAQPSSGATVSTWSDKSGTSNNATSGSATFLKDSLGGYLNFTGSQTYTITNPNVVVNQYFTVFIVEQLQNYTPGLTAGLLAAPNEGPTNTNLVIYYNSSTDASFAFYGNDIYATVSPGFTTNQAQPTRIWSASFIPNSRNLYINGVSIGADTNNTFLTAWVGAQVGYWRYGNYKGKLREIMIYSGIVNTPQRQQIEGYLAWKWGLRSSLPAGHPYINFPPSP